MRIRMTVVAFAIVVTVHSQNSRHVQPGSPLPGVTPQEMELFRIGLEDFMEVETAEDGLGPAFNGTSCAVCHSVPAIGGFGIMTEVRAGRRDEQGRVGPVAPGSDSL